MIGFEASGKREEEVSCGSERDPHGMKGNRIGICSFADPFDDPVNRCSRLKWKFGGGISTPCFRMYAFIRNEALAQTT
jgi:hypothetical protein